MHFEESETEAQAEANHDETLLGLLRHRHDFDRLEQYGSVLTLRWQRAGARMVERKLTDREKRIVLAHLIANDPVLRLLNRAAIGQTRRNLKTPLFKKNRR